MIPLTRLNSSRLSVNCDLIRYMESAPDTVLTLVGGEKLVVMEACEEIAEMVLRYRARVLRCSTQEER
jgi:flagellar protein FlbD